MKERNIIKYETETKLPEFSACPHCGVKLDCSSGVTLTHDGDNAPRPPVPGDISMCQGCGEPCVFGEGLSMEKMDDEMKADVLKDPAISVMSLMIKSMNAAKNPDRQRQYSEQLEAMASDVRKWRQNNPDKDLSIQYNFTKGTGVIAALEDAINRSFISVNENAMQMFKDVGWLDDKPSMPTVLMVRAVMEHVFES